MSTESRGASTGMSAGLTTLTEGLRVIYKRGAVKSRRDGRWHAAREKERERESKREREREI